MKAGNFTPLLWLLLVLVLIPATLALLKRSGLATRLGAVRGTPSAAGFVLRDSLVIGPNQRVVALEVGQGAERRWLVLGVTPQQITALHTLAAPPDSVPRSADRPLVAEGAALPRPSFEVMLARLRGAAARKPGATT
jgi:flagellar protein FliO/FliZ